MLVYGECADDAESETEDVMKKLKSFKRSAWWSDGDNDCISSDDDESYESLNTEEVTIITCKKSKMKKRNEVDENWSDKFRHALGKASRQECVELTRSHQNNDQFTFYMITNDSLGSGKSKISLAHNLHFS